MNYIETRSCADRQCPLANSVDVACLRLRSGRAEALHPNLASEQLCFRAILRRLYNQNESLNDQNTAQVVALAETAIEAALNPECSNPYTFIDPAAESLTDALERGPTNLEDIKNSIKLAFVPIYESRVNRERPDPALIEGVMLELAYIIDDLSEIRVDDDSHRGVYAELVVNLLLLDGVRNDPESFIPSASFTREESSHFQYPQNFNHDITLTNGEEFIGASVKYKRHKKKNGRTASADIVRIELEPLVAMAGTTPKELGSNLAHLARGEDLSVDSLNQIRTAQGFVKQLIQEKRKTI